MATNMDKAVYTDAPQGLEQLGEEDEPIEITIEDPEAVNIKGPGFEIDIEESEEEDEPKGVVKQLRDTVKRLQKKVKKLLYKK